MKHLIPQFILEQSKLGNNQGSFNAFTVFLDMAGFTKLTESLCEEDENEGAELMSQILNQIFRPLVHTMYNKKGFIPYFAGDAFTAIFKVEEDSISPETLAHTVLKMQEDFALQHHQHKGQDLPIRLKIGLAYGSVEWGIIGNEHKGFYFKGEGINLCADSEHYAKQDEVIAHQSFIQHCDTSHPAFQTLPIAEDFYKIIASYSKEQEFTTLQLKKPTYQALQPFFPTSILEYGHSGEFREVVSVFLSFKNVENSPIFNEFASIVREEFHDFGGYFKEIDFGDKGGLIVGFFGAPVTYGDNIERALQFVLSLKNKLGILQDTSSIDYKIGMTSGTAYTGMIGGAEKCQYAVVGTAVNLAARFMSYATWGEILVDKSMSKAKDFNFHTKGDITYKGFEEPISTFKLVGKREEGSAALFEGEMIGRDKELHDLVTFAKPIFDHQFAGIATIFGEAGIGKSRLTFETKKRLEELGGFSWLVCQADQIFQKPFNPFTYLFSNLFEQSLEKTQAENRAAFENAFDTMIQYCEEDIDESPELVDIIKELQRTKTVIAARLGLEYPDSLWSQLDAQGRYLNTISAFVHLLKAGACLRPVILKIEDGHWFDESTKALLNEIVTALKPYPVFILITSRYHEEDNSKPQFFKQALSEDISTLEIDLNILSPDAIEEFAVKKLGGKISTPLKQLLTRTTNGNPFYTEQVLEYFIESNLLEKEEETWFVKDETIKLSGSINAVLMARIDRLSSLVKETVKAAAVIGREFEVQVLTEVMKTQQVFNTAENNDPKHLLQEQITTAEKGQIWKAINEIRYIFKHSLLREAVYDMQIRTRLRELHKLIAEAIERVYAEQIHTRYADLAFHYEQAGIKHKTNEYLEKVGNLAKENYDNTRAIVYYDKLADNLDHIQQQELYIKTLLKKASILRLMGDWAEAERVLQNALAFASSSSDLLLLARANNDLGRLLLLKGDYHQASNYLQIAASIFEDINDEIGRSKVYGNLGDVYFRQGEYERAKDYFKESLTISKDTDRADGNFGIVSNLGLALMNQGKYEEAIQNMQPHLEHSERSGNKLGIANISIFLGIVYYEKGDSDAAMECYEKGLKECEDLGNKFLMAIALGSMGKLLVQKGDLNTAQELYERDLVICREIGDKQGTSITLGLLGDLYVEQGKFDLALGLLEEQLELSKELNYQKGIASAYGSIGNTYYFQGETQKAEKAYQQGIAICEEISNKRLWVILMVKMIDIYLESNTNSDAIHHLSQKAVATAQEIGNEELIHITSVKRSQAKLREGNNKEGWQELERLLTQTNIPLEKAETLFALGMSSHPQAATYKQEALELYASIYHKKSMFSLKRRMQLLA